jgi:hypothetical protein
MKYIKQLIILLFLFQNQLYSQSYIELSYTPESKMLLCTMSKKTIGFYIGTQLKYGFWDGLVYHSNEATIGSFGITAGVLKSGIVIGLGIKTDMISGPDIYFSPDINIRFHPFTLLFYNKNIPVDLSICYDLSADYYFGLGFIYSIKHHKLNKYLRNNSYN